MLFNDAVFIHANRLDAKSLELCNTLRQMFASLLEFILSVSMPRNQEPFESQMRFRPQGPLYNTFEDQLDVHEQQTIASRPVLFHRSSN